MTHYEQHTLHGPDCTRSETQDWCTCKEVVDAEDCLECTKSRQSVR